MRRMIAALVLSFAAVAPASAALTVTNGFVTSFDGTQIGYTFFAQDAVAPVVFNGHGWGGTRTKEATGLVKSLTDAGYNVLTWDARGFGESGGEAQVDSQDFEVKDVQALIDLAATKPSVQLDGAGDPRMGMIGSSYAGGIQLMTASADDRVDVIVPQIAWNDLPQALRPGGVLKLGWDVVLYGAGAGTSTTQGLYSGAGPQTGGLATEIHQSFVEGIALNDWSASTLAWYDARSPKHYINDPDGGIRIPTLLVQGANDSLFPLNHAIANGAQIAANGAPLKTIFFCGDLTTNHVSHGYKPARLSCNAGTQGAFITTAVLNWFDHHLRGNTATPTGPALAYQLQDGTFADAVPNALEQVAVAGTIAGGSTTGVVPLLSATVPVAAGDVIVGPPIASVDVEALAPAPDAALFFRLVDIAPDGMRTVVDDQVMAKRLIDLDAGEQVHFDIDLGGVVWRADPGHTIELQILSADAEYANVRTPFVLDVDATVQLPVVR